MVMMEFICHLSAVFDLSEIKYKENPDIVSILFSIQNRKLVLRSNFIAWKSFNQNRIAFIRLDSKILLKQRYFIEKGSRFRISFLSNGKFSQLTIFS